MRCTNSGGIGAPPPPTDLSDEVSRLVKLGDSSRSQLIVGTPTKWVTRSDSMSARARSGSQRCVMTSLAPLTNEPSMTGTRPVTWNSGTHNMNTDGPAGAPGSEVLAALPPSGSVSPPTAARAANASNALSTARWVETAPFGCPVVPDVYRMETLSSGPISTVGIFASSTNASSSRATPSGSSPFDRTATRVAPVEAPSTIRARRSVSASTTVEPESSIANWSSSVSHHAFSGTATAPTDTIATYAAIHSG